MNIDLIENKIAFEFLEDITNGSFTNTTESGIIVQRDAPNQVKEARWGVVTKCARNVTEVEEGDYILMEPLGWTNRLEVDEVSDDAFWVTTEDRIMAVSKEAP